MPALVSPGLGAGSTPALGTGPPSGMPHECGSGGS